jgi:tRNA nucleotidyltransferase (CCA-adding enzyme)
MPSASPRLRPPKAVREIAATLERAGHETWCVGGAVRDALLDRAHLDWDLATQATPDEVRALFRRTVPVGIDFGTVGVLDRAGILHEVTTFRRDVLTDGRHAVVEFGASLDEDLARRDFTINAIAYSPRLDAIHDPFGGREDLQRKIVRAVGVPTERMREDHLRALRAIRFAARFGFEIEPSTWEAIVDSAPFLTRLSRERIKQELEKTMDQVQRPSIAIGLWRQSGALRTLIPELETQPSVTFAAADTVGVPEQTQRRSLASTRRINRLSTLFLGLEPNDVRRVLRDLRFANRDVEWIGHLVECWRDLEEGMRTEALSAGGARESELRRWAARVRRTRLRDFMRVTAARWSAERAAGCDVPPLSAVASLYRRSLRVAYHDPVAVGDLAIDGNDLQDLGVPSGPRVGELLRELLERVLQDPSLNQRNTLLDLAQRALEGPGPGSPGEP